jgi:hypothetical protein
MWMYKSAPVLDYRPLFIQNGEIVNAATGRVQNYTQRFALSADRPRVDAYHMPGCLSLGGQTTMPSNTWFCFEWHVDGQTGIHQFFIDGTRLRDNLYCDGSSLLPTAFQPKTFNLFISATSGVSPLWLDDIAISNRRLGCK